MSIIQIDKRQPLRLNPLSNRLTWAQKFKRRLYQPNYLIIKKTGPSDDLIKEDQKNQAGNQVVQLIKQVKNKNIASYLQRKQFYDPQTIQSYYSPYTLYVPLQNESYINDQIINTFSYFSHLKDYAKREQLQGYYHSIHENFQYGKSKGNDYVQQQWIKTKYRYFCEIDSVRALGLLLELLKKNFSIYQQLYNKYGKKCCKQIFLFRIMKASIYIKKSPKMHRNIQISVQLGEQINQKTLPMTMKNWYCALCMTYDCQKHKLQTITGFYQNQYISEKNKKTHSQHIQNIIKLMKFYQKLNNKNQDNAMISQQEQKINEKKICGPDCYQNLKLTDIFKLNMKRFMLVSPLAKSLIKLGIQMFSYSPCEISSMFQSKYQKNNSINCNLIFIHFTQQCNLTEMINMKMRKSQKQYLLNENSKKINMNVKIPVNPMKIKKNTYMQKRGQNQNPETAVCMHNFVGCDPIDIKCEKCVCRQRGFCLPTCLCTQYCEIKRIGCNCKGQDSCQAQKCLCFINKLECQPGVCGECFAGKHHNKRNCCRNDQILRQLTRKIFIGVSQIAGAGLGAFAGQNFSKNDLVCKYSGENINSDIDFLRQTMIKDLSFYNFDSPNGKLTNASIDARFMGNKARFINHANQGEQNLRAQTFSSNGTQYIVLFANKEIKEGQQLTFNYDGSGVLYQHHRDKYPFIRPNKRSISNNS